MSTLLNKILLFSGGGAAASTLLTDLAFYYKLDEATGNARVDSTGGASLTEAGTVNSTTGKIGDGAAFVGNAANYLDRTDDAVVSLGDTNYTFRVWVKFTDLANQMVFSQCGTGDLGYFLAIISTALNFQVFNGASTLIGNVSDDTVLATDTWYHVIVYHDADNNRVGTQVNGGTIKWANTTGTAGDSNAVFRVGQWAVDGAYPARGTIDELALWNKLLSADEVIEDYNGGDGNTYHFDGSGVVGYSTSTPTMSSGQQTHILIPSTYNAGTPTTLILYHHGSGEIEGHILNADKYDVILQCLHQGWIVGACRAQANNWGNQAAVDDYLEFYAYLDANYNINRVVFLSQSMGGLTGLLCIADGTIPVDGWYGIYPVCSLADMFDGNAGAYAPAIRTAYGIAADGSDYAAKTAGHDPLLLDGTAFAGVGMRFTASAGDGVVSKTNNSDAMATLVTGHATEYVVVACTGDHGNPSHFLPLDVKAFVDRC